MELCQGRGVILGSECLRLSEWKQTFSREFIAEFRQKSTARLLHISSFSELPINSSFNRWSSASFFKNIENSLEIVTLTPPQATKLIQTILTKRQTRNKASV